MDDRALAEIVARALIMVIRAISTRYSLGIWILNSAERREILKALESDTGPCARAIEQMITVRNNGFGDLHS